MRLGQRVKGFFHRIGKGIKSGAKWVAEKGGKVVQGIRKYAPKVIGAAKTVLNFLPSNKYTDAARKVVEKSDEAYKKADDYVRRGKAAYEAGKQAFSGGGS